MTDIVDDLRNLAHVPDPLTCGRKAADLLEKQNLEIERLRAIINQYGMDTRNVPMEEHMRSISEAYANYMRAYMEKAID